MEEKVITKIVEPTENELMVNYHNDMADISLQALSAQELNVLMYILAVLKDKEEQGEGIVTRLVMPLSEIKKQAAIKTKDKRQIEQQILKVNSKLMGIQVTVKPDPNKPGTTTQFALFPTFKTSLEDDTLTVKLNSDFVYFVNYLTDNYTKFELAEFVSLKNKYSKLCYRQLKRYRDTGMWIVSIEEFKRHMGISELYAENKELKRRVLKPVMNELAQYIDGLEIEHIQDKTKRGRPIVALKFTFTPDKRRGVRLSSEELEKRKQMENAIETSIEDEW